MNTLGTCIISRNDNYGGDLVNKFKYAISNLIEVMDEVYYVDWNSPAEPLIDLVRDDIKHTGKLHSIVVTPKMAKGLTNNNPDVQNCVEVMARNIGIRRLTTDYIIASNSDIMCATRDNIFAGIVDHNTFHTVARRNIDFPTVVDTGLAPGSAELANWAMQNTGHQNQFGGGSPLGERDKWSLISCPGDFQLAHRDVWYGIKGFEESLVYRGYTDSNVQRKADYYGFKQALVRDIVALHFNHYPDFGACGGNTAGWNSEDCLFNFNGTTNPDDWGFANYDFDEEVI